MSHAPDDAVGCDSYQAMLPKLSIETKPRLMVADMTKLTPTRVKEQRARTSKGEHHATAETTNRWDWCVAALSLGYICVHKDLVLGAIRGAMAQPTLGWGFAVAFHVAFGICCTLLIGWGVHKGPGSGWFKRWRDEYLFAYTMLFTTNVFFVATYWPIDQRFVNREVYQPTWDPVFSSMVMLFFHLPPRYLLLQGLEAAVVHSYVAIAMHGLYQGDLSGALMHVLINTGVCAVAPVVMSAAWLNESKQSRHHRSAPRNALQRWLQEFEASLMRGEAQLMHFVARVDRAVLATLCCGPVVGMVIVKNFKAISTPLADPPKVCASSPFEVLAAIMCTAVLILAEVGIKAMTLLKQLRHKEEVVRDIFPQHVVDRMAAHQALHSPASSTSSSRSTRESEGGVTCRVTGYVTSSSHGSSSEGWATPSSGTSGNGRSGRTVSTVTSLTASLSGGIASLSGGFGNYFSRASETDARVSDARMTVSVSAPTSASGSANGSAGDHGDSPVAPVTPLLRQVGQKLGMHKAGSSATSTPKHNSRKSIGSLAQRHAAVTILFADICGFTQMSDVMDPLAVMDMLHSLYSAYDSLSEVLPGVYKIETIGDCYMAASGLIQEHADHAEHMLQFALYMQELASQHKRPDGSPLTIRVGMHSGAITSGLIGSVRKRYCLFGDTVNTASRMETTCTPGGIQISAAMYALVGHISNMQWREKQVEVKGKGLMTVYEWLPSRPTQEEEVEQEEQQHLQDEQQEQQHLHEQQLLEGEEEVQHQHQHQHMQQQLQEVQRQEHDGDEHASLQQQQQQQEIRQWIDQQEEAQPEKEH